MRGTFLYLRFVAVLAVLVALAAAALAQPKPLTNADVISMVKGGLPESVVISAIQANPANYDISPNALIALKKAGISDKVQESMLAAMKPAPAAPPATPAAAAPSADDGPNWHLPTVAVVQASGSQPIPMEKAQLAQTKTKPTSMQTLAADSVMTQAMQGGISTATYGIASKVSSPVGGAGVQQAGSIMSGMMSRRRPAITYVWGVPGPTSATVLQKYLPTFAVNFANAPGIQPDEFEPTLVRLTPAQNTCRIVGATQGKEDASGGVAADWEVYSNFLEERVPASAEKAKPGEYKLKPNSPLLPGEYAVVLRPVVKTKKFAGGDVARGQGNGFVFVAVWPFQVQVAQ